jgi:hypothetical protein
VNKGKVRALEREVERLRVQNSEYRSANEAACNEVDGLEVEIEGLRAALKRIAQGPFDDKRTRGFALLATNIARDALMEMSQ